MIVFQILGIAPQSGCLVDQLNEIYHLAVIASLLVHNDLRPVGHASVWRQVQLQRQPG